MKKFDNTFSEWVEFSFLVLVSSTSIMYLNTYEDETLLTHLMILVTSYSCFSLVIQGIQIFKAITNEFSEKNNA